MRTKFLFSIMMCFASLSAQTVDSIVVRQVDSLIKWSRVLTSKNELDSAKVINEWAGKLALEYFSKESILYAKYCFNYGKILQLNLKYSDAENWYLEAIRIKRTILGDNHIEVAQNLNTLGHLYKDMSLMEKSESAMKQSLSCRENIYGKEHLEYLIGLGNLILIYKYFRQLDSAENNCLKFSEICKRVKGENNPYFANNLVELAIIYTKKSNYVKAEALFLQSINIQEKYLGKENLIYNWTLENFAKMYLNLGKFESAEQIYSNILKDLENSKGENNFNYAKTLQDLALVYEKMGYYERSEISLLKAIKICEGLQGNQDRRYANSLFMLADLYNRIGKYEKAEPLYLKSKLLVENTLGKNHMEYSKILINLANLYLYLNQNLKAEALYLEVISRTEKILGKEHSQYSSSLSNIALVYINLGYYEKAESSFMQAKEIIEKTSGKENQEYADLLNNFGTFYFKIKQYNRAEELFKESMIIKEKVLGKLHPNYATSLDNLAAVYNEAGEFEKSEKLLVEGKEILENSVGTDHLQYTQNLERLIDLYLGLGHNLSVERYLSELSYVSKLRLKKALIYLSERELNNYLSSLIKNQNRILWYAHKTGSGKIVEDCFNNSLFYKGILLNRVSQLKQLAYKDSVTAYKYNEMVALGRRLATEYKKIISERNQEEIKRMEDKVNELEKELSQSIFGFKDIMRQVNWQEAKNALKPGEAILEFVHFENSNAENSDSTLYGALIITEQMQRPSFFTLFEEKSLDSLLHFKSSIKENNINNLYSFETRGAIPVKSLKTSFYESMYEMIWKPLEKDLNGIHTIYYSPSGILYRINQDAIPISKTSRLSDKYKLIVLNSTRQLIIPSEVKIENNYAVLFGGIQYEQDSSFKNIEPLLANNTTGDWSFYHIDSTLRGGDWTYLTGTESEVNSIKKIMEKNGVQAKLIKGYAATEESFKNIGVNNTASPRIIHIATHGYFFPDRTTSTKSGVANDSSTSEGTAKAASSKLKVVPDESESVFKISDHPMLRSGLIMAGGNEAWQGAPTLEGIEDGILTAYEISQMNLSNTELVVLSACETGLGDIQGNEGVYGLQRAFKIAGAKYLIMSLWQVPDKQTSLLMTTFYKKCLQEKMTIPDAFHAAQKELREIGLDPYQWAGFIMVE